MKKRIFRLLVWGVLFGYMEAAVVVYLRAIYYPDGFVFPLKLISGEIFWTEIGREAATLLLMTVTVMLTYTRLQSRMAAFTVLFGTWDIFYYVFLKLLLDWPLSPTTPDILFLIPAPWVGPVWAPLLASSVLVAAGTAVLLRNGRGHYPRFGSGFVASEVAAVALMVASFMYTGRSLATTGLPEAFAWPLFWAGLLAGAAAFFYAFTRNIAD